MKHWNELTELESAIIRVGEFKNLFKLLVAGTENDVDIKVLQSAIYTLEGMIDDIDSTLYDKFQTIFDAVRDEGDDDEELEEEEFEFNFDGHRHMDVNTYGTYTVPQTEYKDSTVQINSTFEEEEAFKDLEKALKNWRKATP
jgi:site-specific DNA-adenine methylase